MELILAEKENISEIVEIDKICFDVNAIEEDEWINIMENGSSIVMCLELEGRTNAYMLVEKNENSYNKEYFIRRMGVKPEFRNLGYGQLLIEKATELGGRTGKTVISARTRKRDYAINHLLTKKGFLPDISCENEYNVDDSEEKYFFSLKKNEN